MSEKLDTRVKQLRDLICAEEETVAACLRDARTAKDRARRKFWMKAAARHQRVVLKLNRAMLRATARAARA